MRRFFLVIAMGLTSFALASAARAAEELPRGFATVEPFGYAVYPLPSKGAEAGFFLAPDAAISFSFAKGNATQLLTKYDASLLLVRYKLLVGSLSHGNFGIGARRFAETLDVPTTTGVFNASAHRTSVIAEASFGSRFNVGPALVACDWLGVALPLATLSQGDNYPDNVDASERDQDRADFAKVTTKPSLELLRLSVGVQF